MADNKKIFKGFKQVISDSFNNLNDEEKQGYLWFVRTPILEGEETDETNDVANDSYDIYFGSKQYGHFCKNEIETIKNRITALEGNVEEIIESLSELTSIVSDNTEAISANTQSIQAINKQLSEQFLLKNIDSNDKILNVADGILSSTISLEYNEGYIKLIGKDNNVISSFDASEFVKDSFLDDVQVIDGEDGEKYIEFTWNTVDNDTKTDRIKVTDFAKFYNAGTALELTTGDTFNVKVASNDNFLTVNNSNELIVTGVTTNKTTTNQAITIEGGPLASDAVKSAFDDGIIPAGTDIQEILKALLCQEIYPNPSANTPTYSVKIKNAPSVTNSSSISNGSLVEVGQEIAFNSVTAVTVTASTITHPKVSKFDHGYATDLTGDTINPATAVTASWDINQSDDTFYKLSAEIVSGFTDSSAPTEVTATTNSNCVLSGCTLTAVLGTNTYKVTEDAPEYTGTHSGVTSYYIVSNLGNRNGERMSPSISANTGLTKTAASSATTFTVTGVYPIFTNGITAGITEDNKPTGESIYDEISGDGTKLSLMNADTEFAVSFAPHEKAGYRLFVPNNWSLKSAYCKHPTIGDYSIDCYDKFVLSETTTTRNIQNKNVEYKIYQWKGTQGEDFLKFTVG